MYLDVVAKPQEKTFTVNRIELLDLLDARDLDKYNSLLAKGVTVTKRIHKLVPGVPGNEFEESTPAKLYEIVSYTGELEDESY